MPINTGELYATVSADLTMLRQAQRENKQILGAMQRDLNGLAAAAKFVFGLYGSSIIIRHAADVIKTADTYTLLSSRIALVTRSEQERLGVERRLFEIAQETRTAYEANAELFTRTARAMRDIRPPEDILKFTEQIQKLVVVSGASSTEAKNAIIQLSQGLALGVLRGQDLRSVMSQLPAVAQTIAESMGVGIGKFREMAAAGEVTAEAVVSGILGAEAKTNAAFERMAETAGQAWQKIENAAGQAIARINKETGATKAIAGGLSTVAENMDAIAGTAVLAGEAIAGVLIARGLGPLISSASMAATVMDQEQMAVWKGIATTLGSGKAVAERALFEAALAKELIAKTEAEMAATAAARQSIAAAMQGVEAGGASIAALKAEELQLNKNTAARVRSSQASLARAQGQVGAATAQRRLTATQMESWIVGPGSQASSAEYQKAVAGYEKQYGSATAKLEKAFQRQTVAADKWRGAAAAADLELKGGLIVQTNELGYATERMATQQAVAARAMAETTFAARLATGATKAFNQALAFVGGPMGAAILASLAIWTYSKRVLGAAEAEQKLQDELDKTYNAMMKRTTAAFDPRTGKWGAPEAAKEEYPELIAEKRREIAELTAARAKLMQEWNAQPQPRGRDVMSATWVKPEASPEIGRLTGLIDVANAAINTLQQNMGRALPTAAQKFNAAVDASSEAIDTFIHELTQEQVILEMTLTGREKAIPLYEAEVKVREMLGAEDKKANLSAADTEAHFKSVWDVIKHNVTSRLALVAAIKAQTEAETQSKAFTTEVESIEREARVLETFNTQGQAAGKALAARLEFEARLGREMTRQEADGLKIATDRLGLAKEEEWFQGELKKLWEEQGKWEDERAKRLGDSLRAMQDQSAVLEEQITGGEEAAKLLEYELQLRREGYAASQEQLGAYDDEIQKQAALNRLVAERAELGSRAQAVIEAQTTGAERMRREWGELDMVMIGGYVTLEQYDEAVRRLKLEFSGAAEMSRQFAGTLTSGLESLILGTDNWADALRNAGMELEKIVLRAVLLNRLEEGLTKGFTSGFSGGGWSGFVSAFASAFAGGATGSAKGNVFEGGRLVEFGGGGIVDRPTVFPMAGGAGLMGEAGPEAVMPLRRTSAGELGVSAAGLGGGDTIVQIIDQRGSGAPVRTEQSSGPNGERVLRVLIRDAMKKDLASGYFDKDMTLASQRWGR